jgi:hypothetical protein
MVPVMTARIASLAALLIVAGCAAPPAPPPPPPKAPPPPPPAAVIDWKDAPLTPGEWSFDPAARSVTFAQAVALRCVAQGIQIESIALPGVMATSLDIRTTGAARTVPAERIATRLIARLPAADPIFDEIAYTRGRWALGPSATTPSVLPARADVARLIETCRAG